jgi:hypothetical protein
MDTSNIITSNTCTSSTTRSHTSTSNTSDTVNFDDLADRDKRADLLDWICRKWGVLDLDAVSGGDYDEHCAKMRAADPD